MRIDLLNGPNLNLLGTREPDVYGHLTLPDLEAELMSRASARGHELVCFQSNHEGALVDRIQEIAAAGSAGAIINPGAYGHSSIAMRDALLGTGLRFVEVHISNVYAREAFRHRSMLSDVASGLIVGLGTRGYRYALDALLESGPA